MKKIYVFLFILLALIFASKAVDAQGECDVPDNGTGTATLPPIGCQYTTTEGVFMIIDGLPPGTTIECNATLKDFICCGGACGCSLPLPPGECEMPGGSLGGNGHCFSANLEFQMSGTGTLAGWERLVILPVNGEVHTAPRYPGEPVQSFQTLVFGLSGQIIGDPDFDLLRITAGDGYGYPSPGQTQFTQIPGGSFAVDSFFDITYRIDFVGAPGGILAEMSGSTTATVKIVAGGGGGGGGGTTINSGPDSWTVPCGSVSFGPNGDYPPLPINFFGPGSDPFDGIISLIGTHSNGSQQPDGDVIVNRLEELVLMEPYPSVGTIPVEMVQLDLMSAEPVKVTYEGGVPDSFFDVFFEISIDAPRMGMDNIIMENPHGGTFEKFVSVYPVITFVEVSDPSNEFIYDPWSMGYNHLSYTSTDPYPWTLSPIEGEFDPIGNDPLVLHSQAGTSISLLPYLVRNDNFMLVMNEQGFPEMMDGSGYNNGTWYKYPNYNWWNVWFYDHPVAPDRRKVITGNMIVSPRMPDLPSYVEIVYNWSTPQWTGWPEIARPPLPEDVMDPAYEISVIQRSEPLLTWQGNIFQPIPVPVPFEILEYNPEWLSIDIRGYNFVLQGDLQHVCWKEGDCGGLGYDYGDAPENDLAYLNGTIGIFPTCINTGPANSYISHGCPSTLYFGGWVDCEGEGNQGTCPTFNPNNYNVDECGTFPYPVPPLNVVDEGLMYPIPLSIVGLPGSEQYVPCGQQTMPLGSVCSLAVWGQNIDIWIDASQSNGGYINILFDWDQNGQWFGVSSCNSINPNDYVPEHILQNFPVPAGFIGKLSTLNPPGFQIGPLSGCVWSRFSLTEQTVTLPWDGSGVFSDGETEDYLLDIAVAGVEELDFGDAPDPSYPTKLVNDGAHHAIDGITFLGSLIDAEADGQPDISAQGDDGNNLDDEDGVLFMWPIAAGNPCKVKVTASVGDALLNLWIDFNQNGSWAEAEDHVFNDLNLVTGDNYLTFIVPANVVSGTSYARFRFSHQPALSYTGYAFDGEVEDHLIEIIEYGDIKWQQIPDENLTGLHADMTSIIADDWICNGGVVTDIHWWGNYESVGMGINHFLIKIYNDASCLSGSTILSFIVPFNTITEMNTGIVNNEGDPIYYYEYFLPQPFAQIQGNTYWVSIQALPNNQQIPAIWRWQESNRWFYPIHCGTAEFYAANNIWQTIFWQTAGKYSDMAFIITSTDQPQENMDFGDAPDDSVTFYYPTLLVHNGARHQIDTNVFLGNVIDAELDGQPDIAASLDDLTGVDDEDGVSFIQPFVAGKTTKIKLIASVNGFLNAWFDFNKNGSWSDAGEQVFTNVALVPGINNLNINVPAAASPGATYSRFRFNTGGGLNYYGFASDGEVEDYKLIIYPPDWGYNPTNSTHLILVPVNVLFNCITLSPGDFVGTFYTNELGNLACSGSAYWDGVSNQVVVAFGDDVTTPAIKEGFDENEDFHWKVYYSATSTEEVVGVGYDAALPDSDGKFHDNGLSGLTYITNQIEVTATATPSVICEGDVVQLDALVSGGCPPYTFLWTSVPAGFTSILQNPTDSPTEATTYYVTVDDGYLTATDEVMVTVIANPGVYCTEDMVVCVNDVPFVLTVGNPTGGTYSGNGVLGNIFDPAIAGVGSHTITYTYVVPGTNCAWSCNFIIVVQPLPQIDCPPFMRACEDEPKVLLNTAYPQGGSYSGSGVSYDGVNYWFDPAIGVGTYLITYCFTDPVTGCSNCCEFNFYVNALPVVVCPGDFTICIDTPPFDLIGATPPGGAYTGNGVISGVFYPAIAGSGSHVITYTYTDPQTNCTNFCTFIITVIEVIVECPDDFAVCVDDAPVTLTGGTPPGGYYSGAGVAGGVFYPAVAGVGNHIITYTYVVPGTNCTGSCTFVITVMPLPQIDCPPFMRACEDDPKVLLNTAYPQGGSYSGPGVSYDGVNYWFDPAIGVGTYLITYCFTDPVTGCSNCCEFNFYVNALPVVVCPGDFTICIDTPPFDLIGATPPGGVYIGNGVISGVFYPAIAGSGSHVITYTYTDPKTNCTNFCTFIITVIEVIVECPDDFAVCVDDAPVTLTGGTPPGGFYSGAGVAGGVFYPAVAGVGNHIITYTYVVPGTNCTGSCTFVITVNDLICQNISLVTGTQFISTYINPTDVNFKTIMTPVLGCLKLAKNSAGKTLAKVGPNWINQIGNWIPDEGYIVTMNCPAILPVCGCPPAIPCNTPIPVSGTKVVPFLPQTSINASVAFGNILPNLILVKNSAGKTLRKVGPNWVNQIGNCNPGEGYLVTMSAADVLVYPCTDEGKSASSNNNSVSNMPVETSHFKWSGGNAAESTWTIYLDQAQIGGVDLEKGDEMAICDGTKIVGVETMVETPVRGLYNVSLTAFKVLGDLTEGYTPGNALSVIFWDRSTGMEYRDCIVQFANPYGDAWTQTVFPSENNDYSIAEIHAKGITNNDRSALSDESPSKMTTTGIDDSESIHLNIYPNPSQGIFTVEGIANIIKISVFDAFGGKIFQDAMNLPAKVDLSAHPKGIYFIRVETANSMFFEKLIIN